MSQSQDRDKQHPEMTEVPEQRRKEETGHEDPSSPDEVGRPPSKSGERKNSEHAA